MGTRRPTPYRKRRKPVAFLGINSLFGRVTSLLLKQCPFICRLNLYDDRDIRVAYDVSNINTRCKVRAFKGINNLPRALKNSDIVLIGSELSVPPEKQLKEVASKVLGYTHAFANCSPHAILVIAASPLNVLVPLVTKTLTECGCCNCNKIMGCTTVDIIRANTLLARELKMDSKCVILPIIGGTSPETRVPVFSHAQPNRKLSKKVMYKMACEIKTMDIEILKMKNEPEAINSAFAIVRFISAIIDGLQGLPNISEITLSRSVLVPGVDFFSLPVTFGREGINHRFGLPKLSHYENSMLECAIKSMKKDDEKADKILQGKTYTTPDCEPIKEEGSKGIIRSILRTMKSKKANVNKEYLMMVNKSTIELPAPANPSLIPKHLPQLQTENDCCPQDMLPKMPCPPRSTPPVAPPGTIEKPKIPPFKFPPIAETKMLPPCQPKCEFQCFSTPSSTGPTPLPIGQPCIPQEGVNPNRPGYLKSTTYMPVNPAPCPAPTCPPPCPCPAPTCPPPCPCPAPTSPPPCPCPASPKCSPPVPRPCLPPPCHFPYPPPVCCTPPPCPPPICLPPPCPPPTFLPTPCQPPLLSIQPPQNIPTCAPPCPPPMCIPPCHSAPPFCPPTCVSPPYPPSTCASPPSCPPSCIPPPYPPPCNPQSPPTQSCQLQPPTTKLICPRPPPKCTPPGKPKLTHSRNSPPPPPVVQKCPPPVPKEGSKCKKEDYLPPLTKDCKTQNICSRPQSNSNPPSKPKSTHSKNFPPPPSPTKKSPPPAPKEAAKCKVKDYPPPKSDCTTQNDSPATPVDNKPCSKTSGIESKPSQVPQLKTKSYSKKNEASKSSSSKLSESKLSTESCTSTGRVSSKTGHPTKKLGPVEAKQSTNITPSTKSDLTEKSTTPSETKLSSKKINPSTKTNISKVPTTTPKSKPSTDHVPQEINNSTNAEISGEIVERGSKLSTNKVSGQNSKHYPETCTPPEKKPQSNLNEDPSPNTQFKEDKKFSEQSKMSEDIFKVSSTTPQETQSLPSDSSTYQETHELQMEAASPCPPPCPSVPAPPQKPDVPPASQPKAPWTPLPVNCPPPCPIKKPSPPPPDENSQLTPLIISKNPPILKSSITGQQSPDQTPENKSVTGSMKRSIEKPPNKYKLGANAIFKGNKWTKLLKKHKIILPPAEEKQPKKVKNDNKSKEKIPKKQCKSTAINKNFTTTIVTSKISNHKNSDKMKTSINNLPHYAPPCPPEYLFGQYIEHSPEKVPLMDQVKEILKDKISPKREKNSTVSLKESGPYRETKIAKENPTSVVNIKNEKDDSTKVINIVEEIYNDIKVTDVNQSEGLTKTEIDDYDKIAEVKPLVIANTKKEINNSDKITEASSQISSNIKERNVNITTEVEKKPAYIKKKYTENNSDIIEVKPLANFNPITEFDDRSNENSEHNSNSPIRLSVGKGENPVTCKVSDTKQKYSKQTNARKLQMTKLLNNDITETDKKLIKKSEYRNKDMRLDNIKPNRSKSTVHILRPKIYWHKDLVLNRTSKSPDGKGPNNEIIENSGKQNPRINSIIKTKWGETSPSMPRAFQKSLRGKQIFSKDKLTNEVDKPVTEESNDI